MFEAIHGSAPRRANQNLANPSGLLLGAVMMLVHIGQPDIAERVHNAWLRTIEDGVHTYDIFDERVSKEKVGTKEFAQAVVTRVGKMPEKLKPVVYAKSGDGFKVPTFTQRAVQKKDVVGADIFIEWTGGSPKEFGDALARLGDADLGLLLVSNRGTLVWPNGHPETFCTDHWCCRFVAPDGKSTASEKIVALMDKIGKAGFDVVKMETLCNFDGQPGYAILKA